MGVPPTPLRAGIRPGRYPGRKTFPVLSKLLTTYVRGAGELGDSEVAVGVAHVRFGARPAQRTADSDEALKVRQVG